MTFPLTTLWPARIGLKKADHVLCLSLQDRDFLVSRMGLSPSRITRIAPAADRGFLAIAQHRDYSRVSRLLFFGTWLKRKGTADVVAAFCSVAEAMPSLRLSIMGAGVPDAVVLGDFPAKLRARVDIYGNLTEGQTADVLREADVFLLPSVFEGTPLTLMESMASGLPVITTATSGMRDVIRHERNGLLVPIRAPAEIASAIRRLASDRELREKLGREAHREVSADFTWERVAEPVREVYESLTGELLNGR